MKRKINNNQNGITLIALVITIIVLLILAGVAISMLSGENGILKQAAKAKTETEKQSTLEQIKLAAMSAMTNAEHKIKNEGELSTALKQQGVTVDKKEDGTEDITGNEDFGIYEVKVNGEVYYIESNGKVEKKAEVITDVTKLTTAVAEKTIYEDTSAVNTTTKQAVIPEGFRVSSEATEQKIDSGLVVIAPDGSEFVWVPVDDISTMYEEVTLSDGTKQKVGKLYHDGDMSSPITFSEDGLREPAVLYYKNKWVEVDDGANGVTLSTLQKEFDEMIKHVGKSKGFYVGRYETSLDDEGNVQSKQGVISATAADSSTYMWYGLYEKQKTYKNSNVGSSMIWGCQYDQMMIWMKKNGKNLTQEIDGSSVGETGTNPTDVINNVYDLYGNGYELTLEAWGEYYRTYRGCHPDVSYTASDRDCRYPFSPHDDLASRLILYVK